ncbi:hypothetical protein ABZY09_46250 [Streptomyces sp. NPDC002928]|uniref:hypothetical protein n=1 Tax=Streptomyces sp. NPDC002928 TaxID=3154440 RepID=UPI0033B77F18
MVLSSSLVPCWSHQSVQAFRLGAVVGDQNRPEVAALFETLSPSSKPDAAMWVWVLCSWAVPKP